MYLASLESTFVLTSSKNVQQTISMLFPKGKFSLKVGYIGLGWLYEQKDGEVTGRCKTKNGQDSLFSSIPLGEGQ